MQRIHLCQTWLRVCVCVSVCLSVCLSVFIDVDINKMQIYIVMTYMWTCACVYVHTYSRVSEWVWVSERELSEWKGEWERARESARERECVCVWKGERDNPKRDSGTLLLKQKHKYNRAHTKLHSHTQTHLYVFDPDIVPVLVLDGTIEPGWNSLSQHPSIFTL